MRAISLWWLRRGVALEREGLLPICEGRLAGMKIILGHTFLQSIQATNRILPGNKQSDRVWPRHKPTASVARGSRPKTAQLAARHPSSSVARHNPMTVVDVPSLRCTPQPSRRLAAGPARSAPASPAAVRVSSRAGAFAPPPAPFWCETSPCDGPKGVTWRRTSKTEFGERSASKRR